MIEPEVAFNDITDNMDLAEEFIKYCVKWALDNCADDVKFLNDMFDKGLIERLQGVLKEDFVRLPYTEGIKILEDAVAKGHKLNSLFIGEWIWLRSMNVICGRAFQASGDSDGLSERDQGFLYEAE